MMREKKKMYRIFSLIRRSIFSTKVCLIALNLNESFCIRNKSPGIDRFELNVDTW